MKHLLAALTAGVCLSLAACGSSTDAENSESSTGVTSVQVQLTERDFAEVDGANDPDRGQVEIDGRTFDLSDTETETQTDSSSAEATE